METGHHCDGQSRESDKQRMGNRLSRAVGNHFTLANDSREIYIDTDHWALRPFDNAIYRIRCTVLFRLLYWKGCSASKSHSRCRHDPRCREFASSYQGAASEDLVLCLAARLPSRMLRFQRFVVHPVRDGEFRDPAENELGKSRADQRLVATNT